MPVVTRTDIGVNFPIPDLACGINTKLQVANMVAKSKTDLGLLDIGGCSMAWVNRVVGYAAVGLQNGCIEDCHESVTAIGEVHRHTSAKGSAVNFLAPPCRTIIFGFQRLT